ncbi:MAG TPA: hypothetical protein O0Y17_00915, partial [Methanocorpusculum sp.]|nr:hypothetical protein [Methanocorpusculum sp.]
FYCEKAYRHAAEEQRKEMAGYREINTENDHSSPDSAEYAEQTKRTEQSNQTAKKPDVSVKRFLDIIDAESRLIQIRGTQA